MATLGKRLLGDLVLPESDEMGPPIQEVDSSSKSNSNQSFQACLIVEHVPLPGGKRRWNRVEYLKGAIVGFKEKGESWTRDLFTI